MDLGHKTCINCASVLRLCLGSSSRLDGAISSEGTTSSGARRTDHVENVLRSSAITISPLATIILSRLLKNLSSRNISSFSEWRVLCGVMRSNLNWQPFLGLTSCAVSPVGECLGGSMRYS